MTTFAFQSCLATSFESFISFKRSGGRDYSSQALLLERFDGFLAAHIVAPDGVDGILLGRYMLSTEHLAPRTRSNLASVAWQALAYARRHGASIPPLPERPRLPRRSIVRPHIYSKAEIDRLLLGALDLGPERSIRPQTYSTLFGLLVTTGIRIGEALQLDIEDIDFEGHALTVRKGKFGKARLVPLHPTTLEGLDRCAARRPRSVPRPSPLFVSIRGRRLAHPTVQATYRKILVKESIRTREGAYPRIHDLRHTFAVRRLVDWYRQGIDVNQRLAALSTYLGHVGIDSTLTYLRPSEAALNEAASRFESQCLAASPEARGGE